MKTPDLESERDICRRGRSTRIVGVYFLIKGDRVVYVGKSINVLSRVGSHNVIGDKEFDAWHVIECQSDELATLERDYINHLMPVHNEDALTRSKRDCSPVSKTNPVVVRFEPEVLFALKKAAESDHRTLSSLISKIIIDWLRNRSNDS